MKTFLSLPPDLTIYQVGALHADWLAVLAEEPDSLEAGAVLRAMADRVCDVDAAGVQLLLSLRRSVEARGAVLQIIEPSAPLIVACTALGVADLVSGSGLPESLS